MTGILRGWHPDPFGVHELRYFTFDGNATRLVRDGDGWSHDAPPLSLFELVPAQGPVSKVEARVGLTTHHARSVVAVDEKPPPATTHCREREPRILCADTYDSHGDPGVFRHDGRIEVCDRSSRSLFGLHEISTTTPTAKGYPAEPEPHQIFAGKPASAGLLHHHLVRRILRYCSVSVVSTVIGLTVLGVLVGVFGWPAVWANVVATAIALAPSFELSRRWVWAHDGRRSILRQAAPYAAISFAGLIVSSIAVHLASDATSNSTRLVHTVAILLANVAAYGSLWIVQFVVCDRILFRSRPKSRHDSNRSISVGDAVHTPENLEVLI